MSKLKENTDINQPSLAQFMSGTAYKKRKNPSEGASPTEKISPPKKRVQNTIAMSDTDLKAMEKRITENVTIGLKEDMKQLMKDSMKDTMKEMIDTSLQSAIESMNAASKRMDECSSNMMSKSVEINALVEENAKLNIKVSQLETEHEKLNKRLKSIEARSLESNLIIKGVKETKWEKEHEMKAKIYEELSKTIVANSEYEQSEIVRKIGIKQCKRLGKYSEGMTRPISVEFSLKEDVDYLLENRSNLRKGIYIDKEYSADIEYQRKLLRPILQAARRTKGLEKKCKLQGASLEIKGKKITTKTLHKLPKELDVFTITSKKEGNVIGFFGELNALSNFHQASFVLDGITFPTSEHYIQYTKAMCFGDRTTALNILNAATPADSKNLGWKISNFDKEKWDENTKLLCYPGIREKFMQNSALLETLLRTKGHKLVESAKDKVWGTGIVLSRDDWHDTTLWDSQGILGEMLTEIRDTYLDAHPQVQVLPLVYKSKVPTRVPMAQSSDNTSLSHTISKPELTELSGIPPPSLVSDQNRHTSFQPILSRSNPDVSNLQGVSESPVINERSVHMQHSSSHPNLDILGRDGTNNDKHPEVVGSSDLSSLEVVPMDGLEQSGPIMNTLEPNTTISQTQASLLSLSQTPHGPLTT